MLIWGVVLIAVATPILTYFFGKRWYCSWVCGCGGLAETAGDPYRHLSDNVARRRGSIERWMVHGVLAAIVAATVLLWVAAVAEVGWLDAVAGTFSWLYGLLIGSDLRGRRRRGLLPADREPRVVPLRVPDGGGPRACSSGSSRASASRRTAGSASRAATARRTARWASTCGGTPSAARTSCGRSCVGCGMCATVCPRGVLKLENGPRHDRASGAPFSAASLIADLDVMEGALDG